MQSRSREATVTPQQRGVAASPEYKQNTSRQLQDDSTKKLNIKLQVTNNIMLNCALGVMSRGFEYNMKHNIFMWIIVNIYMYGISCLCSVGHNVETLVVYTT